MATKEVSFIHEHDGNENHRLTVIWGNIRYTGWWVPFTHPALADVQPCLDIEYRVTFGALIKGVECPPGVIAVTTVSAVDLKRDKPARNGFEFPEVARDREGNFWWYVCADCGGQLFSCPDPACEADGEDFHHLEPYKCGSFSKPAEKAIKSPLTIQDLQAYREWEKERGRK